MGSSREMFISSLAEPVLCLVVFSISLQFGSTSISAFSGIHAVSISCVVAAIALFLVMIAETSRIPVDNQETHLELTMIHEAMVLEYSGKSLAFIEWGSHIKQMIFFFLVAQIIFPIAPFGSLGLLEAVFWFLWYLTRIFIIVILVSLVEVSVVKMRLPQEIQKQVANGQLSMGHARALLSLEDEPTQKKMAQVIIKKGLSVRQVEDLVKKAHEKGNSIKGAMAKPKNRDIEILEEELRKILGTKVVIEDKKGKGKLVIEYYTLDDLDRILGVLRK